MWDIKYRPLKFSDVLGQQGAIQLLKSRLRNGSALDMSYIFAGGHGQVKPTLAGIFARASLCMDLNKEDAEPCNACENCTLILDESPCAFEERDAASGGTIDNVRAMVEDLPFAVLNALKRVWLFDEAHRMSIGAQDVLLKPLEEKKVVGIFCTTEAEKIRGPIRSRCEEYTIRKVTREDVLVRMKSILTAENVPHEDDAVMTVIDYSGGHVRDVINRLEMISQTGEITVAAVREYLNLGLVSIYYEILLALGDPKTAMGLMEQACERVSPDDVSAGIAEAAMNSYRLANGMFADFLYVDRGLAQQVYGRFGVNVVQLAGFFSRGRNVSRTGLSCDIVSLGSGTVPAPSPGNAGPPIVIACAAPTVSASTPVIAPPQTVVASNPPVAQVAQQAPTTQQPATVASSKPAVTGPISVTGMGKRRADGIGPLGSGDGLALTDDDHKGVPQSHPRRSNIDITPLQFGGVGVDEDPNRTISREEWKREFTRTWPRS